MRLTTEQTKAITAQGSVAITASAGSGKTTTLVDRYLFHLAQGVDPLAIVAVTFTDRASHELRSRIRARVAQSESLHALAPLIDAAPIGTIHSFCRSICLEFPTEAGTPVSFDILKDDTMPLYRQRVLLHALDQESLDLVDVFGFTAIQEIGRLAMEAPDSLQEALALDRETLRSLIQKDQEMVAQDPRWHTFIEELRAFSGNPSDRLEIERKNALDALYKVISGDMSGLDTLGCLKINVGQRGKWALGGMSETKSALKEIRDAVKGLPVHILLGWTATDIAHDGHAPTLAGFVARILTRYRDQKRADGYLDYADLELHARQAIAEPVVRGELASRYQAFLIDEFQDTNHLQMAILGPLAKDGVLTVVGDPKQSIYRFRGAEPEIFKKVANDISANGGTKVVLTQTFRSHKGITKVINDTFSSLFETNQELESTIESPGGPSVTLVVPGSSERSLLRQQMVRASAVDVAARISQLLEGKTLIRDRESGELRPVAPGDIAVLCSRWGPLDTFAQACWEREIPAVVVGGGRLLDTQEAKDGMNLLRFLGDPNDDIGLLGLLRSPYIGLSDLELLEISRDRDPKTSWWETLTTQLRESSAVKLLESVSCYHEQHGPARGFAHACEALCIKEILAQLPDANRRLADFDGIANLATRLGAMGLSTAEIISYLQDVAASTTELPRPRAGSEATVSLMTIHYAKGLEWPVVFVVDVSPAGNHGSPTFLVHNELGYGLKERRDEVKSAGYAYLTYLDKIQDEEETLRKWYVALTRARDILVVSCTQEKDSAARLVDALTAARVPLEEWDPSPPPTVGEVVLKEHRPELTPLLEDLRKHPPLTPFEFAHPGDAASENGHVLDQNWSAELMLQLCQALMGGQDPTDLAFPALLIQGSLEEATTRVNNFTNHPLLKGATHPKAARWRQNSVELIVSADLIGEDWVACLVKHETNITWAAAVARCYGVDRVYALSILDGSVYGYENGLHSVFSEVLKVVTLNEANGKNF